MWIHITQRSFLHDWFLPFLSAIPCLYLLSKRLWCVDKKGNFNTMEHQSWNNTKEKDVIMTNMKRIITVFVILFCLVFIVCFCRRVFRMMIRRYTTWVWIFIKFCLALFVNETFKDFISRSCHKQSKKGIALSMLQQHFQVVCFQFSTTKIVFAFIKCHVLFHCNFMHFQ